MSSTLASQLYVYTLLIVWLAYGGWTTARTYRGGGGQDRGTRLVFVAGIFLPFLTLPLIWLGVGNLDPAWATPLRWIGGTVMLLGIALWVTSIRTLGRYFSVNVDIPDDHAIVDRGPYAVIRHPAYAGMILVELGFGISTANWLCALAFLVIPLVAFSIRIRVEEAALLAHFGDSYAAYMAHTKRLIPGIY